MSNTLSSDAPTVMVSFPSRNRPLATSYRREGWSVVEILPEQHTVINDNSGRSVLAQPGTDHEGAISLCRLLGSELPNGYSGLSIDASYEDTANHPDHVTTTLLIAAWKSDREWKS